MENNEFSSRPYENGQQPEYSNQPVYQQPVYPQQPTEQTIYPQPPVYQQAGAQQPTAQRPANRQRPAGQQGKNRPANGNSQTPANRRPPNSRRRRRTKMQIFKEVYLPWVLLGAGILLILSLVIFFIVRSNDNKDDAVRESIVAAQSEEAYRQQLEAEAKGLIEAADKLAAGYDFDGAIETIDSFSDDKYFYEFTLLVDKRAQYVAAKESMVEWNDPSKVISLSTHHLIAEPVRAFSHETYNLKYSFLTVDEFSFILQSLYDNNFILVSMDDIVEEYNGTYKAKSLYLPEGKKPLMLIQTHNSPRYLFDSDINDEPDCFCGFANRMLVNDRGKIVSEYTNRKNQTLTGEYDLVPILEAFIEKNPDFSYRGARATIAVTGRYSLFGYQTNPSYKDLKGEEYYNKQVSEATKVANKLKELGYDIACYTYGNKLYGDLDIADIQADLENWNTQVAPIVGKTDTLVFAMDSDIAAPKEAYSGSKYEVLNQAGFRYFIGFCDKADPWMTINSTYVRQGRITINGSKLMTNPGLYEDIFDAVNAKDQNRK